MKVEQLIDWESGTVSNAVFSDALYQRELDRVFGKCWLFIGHDSLLPNPNDYFTSYMGEDLVIVQRDAQGHIRVYLNKCRHRGNEICVYDAGNTLSFTCSYHGWTYTSGKLTGVPSAREAYVGELSMEQLGLVEAPKVANYGGLIFACWDEAAQPLETYLGDACWYLENFLLREEMGGLEIVPGPQRYIMPINWKLLAENFAGDDYHFISSHASLIEATARRQDNRINHSLDSHSESLQIYSVAANHGKGASHGFLELRVGDTPHKMDHDHAEALGPECVEWVEERRRRHEERLRDYVSKPYAFHAGNIFPNFALIGVGSATYAKGLILHHPRSAEQTEVWMWCAIEKNAPPAMKARQRFVLMQRQAAAGMVAPDDHENFQRIRRNIRSPIARRTPFHYGMALGHDDDDPRPPELRVGKQWPGLILPKFSEAIQRDFYRYWSELMEAES